MEPNNKYFFLPIRLCFIKVYTYSNLKPTPYQKNKKIKINKRSERDTYSLCTVVFQRGKKRSIPENGLNRIVVYFER